MHVQVSVSSVWQYETGLIGLQWDNINEEYNYFRFSSAILIMGLDTLIYFALTLYLDRVWPSRYGQREPWYFLCTPSFWCPSRQKQVEDADISSSEMQMTRRMSTLMSSEVYEPMGSEYIHKGAAISVRDLKKTFGDPFGQTEVKAVNGVSLDIYEGEIFCLLGHNGAGKTTTIGMLTGLLEISSGDAKICGLDVKTQMTEIRKSLGVCPQHDVLWSRLTCREHLELFARLKGVPKEHVPKEAEEILQLVGLEEKTDDFPPNMSGGQRRKLSLGIALIGGSKIVFLDEPTSGMDPQSRRTTWNLIQKVKKDRAIVLTTHFMDEADILGDRIAIMSTGVVRCCGSPLFLKQKFGVGYTFVVSLEAGIKPTVVKAEVDAIVMQTVEGASVVSVAGGEIAYRLPFTETQSFPDMLEALDAKKKDLRITGYGVSVTTLEEVFMKIGEDFGDIDKETGTVLPNRTSILKQGFARKTSHASSIQERETAPLRTYVHPENGATDAKEGEGVAKSHSKKDEDESLSRIFAQPTFRLQDQKECDVLITHCWAIMYKRFWWSLRDARAMLFVIVLPCLLTALNFGVQNLQLAIDYPNL
ncbi:ATP-binding cassette sub-family A member 3 isoform 2, partial [Reticulomyxa filosa]